MIHKNILTVANCTLVFGFADAAWIQTQRRLYESAPDLASRIGATMVLGTADAIQALRLSGFPDEMATSREVEHAKALGAGQQMIHWLQAGDRSPAADTLCNRLFGHPLIDRPSDPVDAQDVLRSVRMVQTVSKPEDAYSPDFLREIKPMGDLSPIWEGVLSRFIHYWKLAGHAELSANQWTHATLLYKATLRFANSAQTMRKAQQAP